MPKYTYEQAREVIRDICGPKGVNQIKAANKELKRLLPIVEIDKREDEFSTIVWYTLNIEGELYDIGYDFWNGALVS